jgi:hypothetical protein
MKRLILKKRINFKASRRGIIKIVELLLFYGVDQNIQDKDGQTALIKGIYIN